MGPLDRVNARRVEEAPAGGVGDHRVVGPAIPQPGHDIDEGVRPLVAQRLLHRLRAAEVQRGAVVQRGDDVPPGAAAAQMVERGELGGDGERLVIGGGQRRHQAEPLGHAGDGGNDRHRVEVVDGDLAHHLVAALARVQGVADEIQVELAALGDLGGLAVVVEVGDRSACIRGCRQAAMWWPPG
ncbi:MAG: hypothetical protein WDN49_24685 [Acetobacteraceae bacterium]